MVRSTSHLMHYNVLATDGELGRVKNFLFDDRDWVVRYLVADSRKWLPGRKVLLSPAALLEPRWEDGEFPVALSRGQVRESPGLDEHEPVSRQQEKALHDHYGWAPYWPGPVPAYLPVGMQPGEEPAVLRGDAHLRSVPPGRTALRSRFRG